MKTFKGRRRQGGSTIIEAAIGIPVLLTLTLGVIDFGWMFFVRHNMVNAAQTAARAMAVGAITSDEAVARARGLLEFSPQLYTITAQETDTGVGGDVDVTVRVSVPMVDMTLFGFMPWVDSSSIVADVTLREES